ncbi:hypothetical protein PGTUg99_020907 [Puccinia graminis f. sp. tritici]|uniref:Uncharacterized protein n=1 Tax=Puccinia graminis f. sp. tritici TaxID=56615 RepID=A0A5B0RVZ3_PUCGR|nr:hypothetical protein PGTUg99_020907 [Puccinia graminis f. sp. tritici]
MENVRGQFRNYFLGQYKAISNSAERLRLTKIYGCNFRTYQSHSFKFKPHPTILLNSKNKPFGPNEYLRQADRTEAISILVSSSGVRLLCRRQIGTPAGQSARLRASLGQPQRAASRRGSVQSAADSLLSGSSNRPPKLPPTSRKSSNVSLPSSPKASKPSTSSTKTTTSEPCGIAPLEIDLPTSPPSPLNIKPPTMSNPYDSHAPGRGPPTRSQPFENFIPMDRVPFGLPADDHDQLYLEPGFYPPENNCSFAQSSLGTDQPTAAYFDPNIGTNQPTTAAYFDPNIGSVQPTAAYIDPNFTATQTAHSYSQPSQTIHYHTQPNPALTHPNDDQPAQYHNQLDVQPSSLPVQTPLPSHPTSHVPLQPDSHAPLQPTSHAVSKQTSLLSNSSQAQPPASNQASLLSNSSQAQPPASNQTLLMSNSSQAQPPASNQTSLLSNSSQAQPPAATPLPSWVSNSSQAQPPAGATPLPSWEQLTQDAEDAYEQQQSNSARGAPGRGTARGRGSRARGASTAKRARGGAAPRGRGKGKSTPGKSAVVDQPLADSSSTRNSPQPEQPDQNHEPDRQSDAAPRDLPSGNGVSRASCRRLEPDVLALYKDESLDELRRLARKFATTTRITAEQQLELWEIYVAYQREIHIMAITHKLDPGAALEHLGNNTRIRGPSNYNNFCSYDPEAAPIHNDHTIPFQTRSVQCAALWRKLDKKTKDKYRDPDFLATLPNPYLRPAASVEADQHPDNDGNPEQGKKQLRRLSEAYQVEGFMVFVLRRKKRSIITAGGSHLGQEFIDMVEGDIETGPCQDFVEFVNGQKAIKKLTGKDPLPVKKPRKPRRGKKDFKNGVYDKGSKDENLTDVREKLRTALTNATCGRYDHGWPSDTKVKLKELGVKMWVKHNNLFVTPESFCGALAPKWNGDLKRLQVAIGEGWFKLEGPDHPGSSGVDVVAAGEADAADATAHGDSQAGIPSGNITQDQEAEDNTNNAVILPQEATSVTGKQGWTALASPPNSPRPTKRRGRGKKKVATSSDGGTVCKKKTLSDFLARKKAAEKSPDPSDPKKRVRPKKVPVPNKTAGPSKTVTIAAGRGAKRGRDAADERPNASKKSRTVETDDESEATTPSESSSESDPEASESEDNDESEDDDDDDGSEDEDEDEDDGSEDQVEDEE